VDELLFAFGGTLNSLNRFEEADPNFRSISAPYNWWVRDNSTTAPFDGDKTGLYFGRLNRFYLDGGFGKGAFVNDRTWFADIHGSAGPGLTEHDLTRIRTNHHRHGAFGDKKFMRDIDHKYQLSEEKHGFKDVYKALVPCMLAMKRKSDAGEWVSPGQAQEIMAPCLIEDNATTY
jgi:hypothetical protein